MESAPLSARNRGAHRQSDNAFPPSARNGLIHIFFGLVERNYLVFPAILREIQRIGRMSPVEYSGSRLASINSHGLVEVAYTEDIKRTCELRNLAPIETEAQKQIEVEFEMDRSPRTLCFTSPSSVPATQGLR